MPISSPSPSPSRLFRPLVRRRARLSPASAIATVKTLIAALAFAGVAAVAVAGPAANAFDAASPVGVWRSLDDRTGKERALIRIDEEGGKYVGRIEATDPADAGKRCTACKDDRKGAPIIGLAIIRNVERVGASFDHGDILDPRNGTVYSCQLRLEQDGKVLVVRGYLGVSLLGGTRRWYRVS